MTHLICTDIMLFYVQLRVAAESVVAMGGRLPRVRQSYYWLYRSMPACSASFILGYKVASANGVSRSLHSAPLTRLLIATSALAAAGASNDVATHNELRTAMYTPPQAHPEQPPLHAHACCTSCYAPCSTCCC